MTRLLLPVSMLIFSIGSCVTAAAQRLDSTASNKKRLIFIGASVTAAYTGSMIGLNEVWYSQSPHQSFRFFNDAAEWRQVDKVGHFYSAFQLASTASRMLQWGKLPSKKSDRIGLVASMVIMSSIEVFDGYSAAYGASASDLAANAAGNLFYLGQSMAWNEVRIYPKFSVHHTALAAVNPNQLGNGWSEEIIKDYNGQTYWLSVDMDKFIRFPRWLNVCIGYGAQNMIRARDAQNSAAGYLPFRQYYLGLDFDLTAFKGRSKVVNTLIYFVNMLRIPAPALEFSRDGVRAKGFYF